MHPMQISYKAMKLISTFQFCWLFLYYHLLQKINKISVSYVFSRTNISGELQYQKRFTARKVYQILMKIL